MTYNKIIRGLEHCKNEGDCFSCPLSGTGYCVNSTIVAESYYGLIAELDDLKRDDLPRCKDALRRANEMGIDLEMENEALKAEIERLQNKVEELSEVLSDTIRIRYAECRAEAIKEFAQDLKEALYFTEFGTPVVDVSDIDDFVKEMVGDDNENL